MANNIEEMMRARLDDNESFQNLEQRLNDMAFTGFSAWDLSYEQGVGGLRKNRRAKKRKSSDMPFDDEDADDRLLPSFVEEIVNENEDAEILDAGVQFDADGEAIEPVTINPDEINIESEDLVWTQNAPSGPIRMHSTAAPGSMPGAACLMIRNLVTRAITNMSLDLDFIIARSARFGISYNRLRFAAATIRMQRPKSTVLILPTGVIVTTGSREKTEAREATDIALKIIGQVSDENGHRPYRNIRCRKITVHNIVASTFVNFTIDLERFRERNTFAHFDPQEFVGASVMMKYVSPEFQNTGVTVLVFDTGGIVITGASHTSQMRRVYDVLFPYLLECMIDRGLSLEDRVSEDVMRRAQTDFKRAIEAGANSDSVIAIDADTQDQMLLEMAEKSRNSLELVPAHQRRMDVAVYSATGGSSLALAGAAGRLTADVHNMLAIHTHDRSDELQEQLQERLKRRKMDQEAGVTLTQVNVISSEEARKLPMSDFDDGLSTRGYATQE